MTGRRFSLALVLAAVAWLGGCGGTGSSQDAGCKKSPMNGKCAWTPCSESVAAACSSGSLHCLMTWPSDVTAFCSTYADQYSATLNCGAYYVFSAGFIEGATDFYYSAKTGQLVGIIDSNGQWQTKSCTGGPSGFVGATCDTMNTFTCPDAGP